MSKSGYSIRDEESEERTSQSQTGQLDVTQLRRSRKLIKSALTRINTFALSSNIQHVSVHTIRTRLSMLESTWADYVALSNSRNRRRSE